VPLGCWSTARQAGAGLLDADAALRGTVATYPAALNLGAGGLLPEINRGLTITNVGSSSETFAIVVSPRNDDVASVPATSAIQLAQARRPKSHSSGAPPVSRRARTRP
jgi:hypothetical protein